MKTSAQIAEEYRGNAEGLLNYSIGRLGNRHDELKEILRIWSDDNHAARMSRYNKAKLTQIGRTK